MALDINREIASIRNRQGDNYLAIAQRKIQDSLNQITTSTAAPAASTATPAATSTATNTAVIPSPIAPAPLVVGGNAIVVGGAWPSINIGADPATTTAEGVVKLAQDLGGTADLPKVRGLQAVPVSATAPIDGQLLTYVTADSQWEAKAPAYDLVSSFVGNPGDGATVMILTFTRSVTFAANFSGSQGTVGTNPTATATYTVNKNGSSVGTIQISTAGAFTFATSGGAAVSFAAGDRLTITAPSPQDATLADVGITLAGTR